MNAQQPESDISILYHEGPCIVVNKPAGVLTQAPSGIDSVETRVKQYLRRTENKTGNIYLGVPHRLDRPVSGAMVFARHVRAARRLAEQFEGRTVEKTYWAIVHGRATPESGTWTDHLRKVPGEARVEVVPPDHPDARRAVLHYRVADQNGPNTLLEIQLETGRTHQVRIQAASRGLPILGDQQYGSTRAFGPIVSNPRDRAIALHAKSLRFRHPMTREKVLIEAPLPPNWG